MLFQRQNHQIRDMKDRIRLVMESQHMTQGTFANFIGMSPASLSPEKNCAEASFCISKKRMINMRSAYDSSGQPKG